MSPSLKVTVYLVLKKKYAFIKFVDSSTDFKEAVAEAEEALT